ATACSADTPHKHRHERRRPAPPPRGRSPPPRPPPPASTYIANPPYFEGMTMTPAPVQDIVQAKPLAILGDSITTDHISPAGSIKADSPAGKFLQEHQVSR